MIGIKVKGKGIMGVEIPTVAGTFKYFFPNLETLKYRKILTIQPAINGFITPSMLQVDVSNAKLTLKNKKGNFIIRDMPMSTINFAYERGFVINDEIDFPNSFIEYPNGNNYIANSCIQVNIIHTDEKSDIRYGYISETIMIPNANVWQPLSLFTKLDDTYPVIALDPPIRASGAYGISLLLKNTSGVIILDKVDDQIFIPQARLGMGSATRLYDDFDKLNPIHFDFQTSEIYYAASNPIIPKSYTLGLYYRRT